MEKENTYLRTNMLKSIRKLTSVIVMALMIFSFCAFIAPITANATQVTYPTIRNQPNSPTVTYGSSATITAEADVGSVRWQYSTDGGGTWTDISTGVSTSPIGSGSNSFIRSTLTINNTTVQMTGYRYHAIFTNTTGKGDIYTTTTDINAGVLTVNALLPTITTTDASNITSTSVSTGGNVTSEGGATGTVRGVVYGTAPSPVVEGSKVTATVNGSGNFTVSITGLKTGTTYYYRAYATNSAGTSYGTEKTFITLNQYTATFNSNGGSAVPSQTVDSGQKFTQPVAPTRTGCTFGGWYMDAGLNTAYNFNTVVGSNIVLYAKWNINSYTVTFKNYDGTTLKTESVNYGSSATAPANPSRTGYNFTGWDKAFNNITVDTIVTAQYTINSYTVTFKDYDGTTLKTESVNYGSSATAPSNPNRTGYTFTGWDKALDNITADTTVTAQYSIKSYTVTFKDYDSTTLKTESVNYGSSATAPLVPGKLGYTFTWDKTFNQITEDITITGQYNINQYKLTVIGGEGSGTYDASVNVVAKLTATAPADNQKFAGWMDETGSIISHYDTYNFRITSDKTLTAVFIDKSAAIIPNVALDNSVIELNVTNTYGKIYFISTIALPLPAGYEYVGSGVVMSKTVNIGLTKANALTTLKSTSQNTAGQFYSIFNVTYGNTLYVRSYVEYKNTTTGEIKTDYSANIVTAKMTMQ